VSFAAGCGHITNMMDGTIKKVCAIVRSDEERG
jgi:hypothetical protein